MTIQNILIVSTMGMGDCLWGTPGVRELKNTYPDAKIDLIVKKDWIDLFKNNPHLEKIYSYQNRWYSQIVLGIKLLLKPKYAHFFIFHANSDFVRMKRFLKSSSIWNHQGHKWCPDQYNIKSKKRNNSPSIVADLHAIERRFFMLKEIKVKLKQPKLELFFSAAEKNSFSEYANDIGLKTLFIVCHIGAGSVDRLWKSKNFYSLTNLILKKLLLILFLVEIKKK